MREELDPLVLDLVEWIARESRPYKEVLDVWRTSCPRLTVWEDAIDRGFVSRTFKGGQEAIVEVTPAGRAFLAANGRRVQGNEQGKTGPVQASLS